MPLIKAKLASDINLSMAADAEFKSELYKISQKAMDRFQSAQKQAQINAGTIGGFAVAQKLASLAFAMEMQKINVPIAKAVSKHVADAVNDFVKSASVKVTIPPGAVTIGAAMSAIPTPAPIPLVGVPPATGGLT